MYHDPTMSIEGKCRQTAGNPWPSARSVEIRLKGDNIGGGASEFERSFLIPSTVLGVRTYRIHGLNLVVLLNR